MMLASNHVRDAVTESQWQIILQAAREAALYQRQLWSAFEQEARETVLLRGATLYTLTEAEIQTTRETAQAVYEPYLEKYPEMLKAIAGAGVDQY
jgi:TRAP-type C4-dicarboxylate transport system substrate-binding protein